LDRLDATVDVFHAFFSIVALSLKAYFAHASFITSIAVQDEDGGGISDRPDDMVDVFHTFFGLAALSLMGHPGLKRIDPVTALPVEVMERLRDLHAASAGGRQLSPSLQPVEFIQYLAVFFVGYLHPAGEEVTDSLDIGLLMRLDRCGLQETAARHALPIAPSNPSFGGSIVKLVIRNS
jgi:hypothetical protein